MMRGENILLSEKEARRVYVMEKVLEGQLTVKEGARLLNLSERQVKRLKKGMKEKGVLALAHGNRGRTPKHAISKDIKDMVASLAQSLYKNASAQQMAELLNEYQDINISPQSIRRILKEKAILNPHSRHHRRRHKSRDRAPKEGLLIQFDASPYEWLPESGSKLCLHGAIDDATGKILGLSFRLTEDLKGYFEVLRQVITYHGIPRALYSDGHAIFFSPKKDKLSIEEELAGHKVSLTQFGRALHELGVAHIHARSPQAKGRIERLWETLQGRLVVELRVAGISTVEEANTFLPGFIKRFNGRFSVNAKDPEAAYKKAPAHEILDTVLCIKEQRKASNGSVISYHGQLYRLVDKKDRVVSLPPRAKVDVLLHPDSSQDAVYQGRRYGLMPFFPKPLQKPIEKEHARPVDHKPSKDHPWRKLRIPKPDRDPVESYFRQHEKDHNEAIGWL